MFKINYTVDGQVKEAVSDRVVNDRHVHYDKADQEGQYEQPARARFAAIQGDDLSFLGGGGRVGNARHLDIIRHIQFPPFLKNRSQHNRMPQWYRSCHFQV